MGAQNYQLQYLLLNHLKILKHKKNGRIDGRSQKSEAQLKILEKAREKAKLIRDEKLKIKREKELR